MLGPEIGDNKLHSFSGSCPLDWLLEEPEPKYETNWSLEKPRTKIQTRYRYRNRDDLAVEEIEEKVRWSNGLQFPELTFG